jgi:SAM-dependent methyltransferase
MYERYSEVLDTVLQRARVGGGMRVLDIGTGTGNLALRCVAKGASVVGLDPSERMLAGARRKAESIPDVDFQRVEDPRVLKPGAGWALGDLAFESQEAERRALQKGLLGEEEYFARVEELRPVFANLDTELYAEQFTPVTWVFWATVAGAQNAH